jgi:hypothetical protein
MSVNSPGINTSGDESYFAVLPEGIKEKIDGAVKIITKKMSHYHADSDAVDIESLLMTAFTVSETVFPSDKMDLRSRALLLYTQEELRNLLNHSFLDLVVLNMRPILTITHQIEQLKATLNLIETFTQQRDRSQPEVASAPEGLAGLENLFASLEHSNMTVDQLLRLSTIARKALQDVENELAARLRSQNPD